MAYGYNGKILHVDLYNHSYEIEEPGDDFYRKYFGGSAMGLYYLFKNTKSGIDPLGPENTLVFALSVLTGAPISGQSRMTAVAKSPLSGMVGDSQSGGFFPAELKFSGYDAIVITGKSSSPVYLWINNGKVQFLPAKHLWGKVTGDTEAIIRSELGDEKIQVLQVGPAGENMVRFAAIMNMSTRANGRTGMGAVMASKNLNAIAVRVNNRPHISDSKRLNQLAKQGPSRFAESGVYSLGILGTSETVGSMQARGGLITHNWERSQFDEGWKAIDGITMKRTILKDRHTCYACMIRCKRVVEVDHGPYLVDPLYGGPEYETLGLFGSSCGVGNLEAVAYANQLCNMYGMDTISCGGTIAWAMECFEKGIITLEDTGGIDLHFGNADALVQIVKMIALREGFGNILAEGSARAAEIIGRNSRELTVTVKKQELPAHMPHLKRSLALIYSVNPFGADHQSSEHDAAYNQFPAGLAQIGLTNPQPDRVLNEEKVRYALTTQFLYSFMDSADLCQFVFGPSWQLYSVNDLVEFIQAVTSWDMSVNEILTIGERRLNLLRAFNAREGIGREEDQLPEKLRKAITDGINAGLQIDFDELERAKDLYYAMAGWDIQTGQPTERKLESLGLGWLCKEVGVPRV